MNLYPNGSLGRSFPLQGFQDKLMAIGLKSKHRAHAKPKPAVQIACLSIEELVLLQSDDPFPRRQFGTCSIPLLDFRDKLIAMGAKSKHEANRPPSAGAAAIAGLTAAMASTAAAKQKSATSGVVSNPVQ